MKTVTGQKRSVALRSPILRFLILANFLVSQKKPKIVYVISASMQQVVARSIGGIVMPVGDQPLTISEDFTPRKKGVGR